MVYITEFRARERFERGIHLLTDSRVFSAWHRPHFGHVGAEMLQLGFILALFAANLLYVLSMNDFRTGYGLVVAAFKNVVRLVVPARQSAQG